MNLVVLEPLGGEANRREREPRSDCPDSGKRREEAPRAAR